ncbi:hypothetical protein [Moraxella lacunata]
MPTMGRQAWGWACITVKYPESSNISNSQGRHALTSGLRFAFFVFALI